MSQEQTEGLPLDGIRVIDLTRALSGPSCVRQLADWGADVVRIDGVVDEGLERPRESSDKQNLHRNKRSLQLDLRSDRGREIFFELAKKADVIVENMRPQSKDSLGIGYAAVAEVNPRIVYGSLSGYGQTGPFAERPCFDPVMQAFGGLMSVTGTDESGPMKTGVSITDLASGIYLCLGIMGALYQREKTGRGQWVTTSLLEASIGMLEIQASLWVADGKVPERVGNGHAVAYPVDRYRTSDGYLSVVGSYGKVWDAFARLLEIPEDLKRLRSTTDRVGRRPLDAFIEEKMTTRTSADWEAVFTAASVPASPVQSVPELFDHPQVKSLGLTTRVEGSNGPVTLLRSPITLSGSKHSLRLPAPMNGAHTYDILRELEISPEDIRALSKEGVVGGTIEDSDA